MGISFNFVLYLEDLYTGLNYFHLVLMFVLMYSLLQDRIYYYCCTVVLGNIMHDGMRNLIVLLKELSSGSYRPFNDLVHKYEISLLPI